MIRFWQTRFEQWLRANGPQQDHAHDVAHLRRVWLTAQRIMQGTEADALVVLAGSYFHDVVMMPKNHPERHQASFYAAAATRSILCDAFPDFPPVLHDAVAHVVASHSFSAGMTAKTLEAKIVQDADRLESLGAIGLARVFYIAGGLGSALFDSDDPLAKSRELDDRHWALDHFQQKLFTLPDTMQTLEGKRLAQHNTDFLVHYLAKLCAELQGDLCHVDDAVLKNFSPYGNLNKPLS